MKTYIIKNEKDLEKFKDDYGYKIDGHAEFQYSAEFTGRLLVEGLLSIKAGGSIEAGGSIKAGWSIKAGGSIKAGWSIKAGGSIEAGGSIKAGWSIEAGEYIEAGKYIEASDDCGISAGLSITCKGRLSFGLKAFAGICTWKEISDEEKTITCSKLEGGGVVEYGILVETGLEEDKPEKMITLSNGKKVSESTVIEALKAITEE